MSPSPDMWRLAVLAALVAASFAALFLLRRQATGMTGKAGTRSARAIASARRGASRLGSGRSPRRWARARMQLAMLQTEAGGRNFEATALREAAALLDSIVPVLEQEGLTAEWASAVYYRGRAEWGLGMLGPGTGGLERAVATFRHLLALEKWPRHLLRPVVVSLPAVILVDIGQRTKDPERLAEGLALAREAAAGARRRIPVEWAIVHRNLSHCLAILGRDMRDVAMLEEAVSAAREAVAATRRSRYPSVWAASMASLAYALAELGEVASDAALLREAIAVYGEAAESSDEEALHEGRVSLSRSTGHALLALGRLTGDAAMLRDSIGRLDRALAEFRQAGLGYAQAETAKLLGLAHAALGSLGGDDGHRIEARRCYDEALLIFQREGATGQANEIEAIAAREPEDLPAMAGFVPGYQVK